MQETKICIKCGLTFPKTVEYFHRNKLNKDGLKNWCKKCEHEYQKEYYKNNKEKKSSYARERYKNNTEHILEVSKQYRRNSKEHRLEYNRQWRKNNRERASEYTRQYNKNNKERIANRMQKWYENNKERISEVGKKWAKNNKEKVRIKGQNYRTRKHQLASTLTAEQWKQIKKYFSDNCAYCGRKLPLEQDHFIALNKGGEYSKDNIIPACRSCNASKKDKPFKKWYPKRKYYSKEREKKILEFLGYKNGEQQLKLCDI